MSWQVFDANGALITALSSIPTHGHLGGSDGGQLNASLVFGSGAVPIGNGGTGQATQTAAMDALSPTTTKGDIPVDNGTNVIRLAVGADGLALIADSASAAGLKYGVGKHKTAIIGEEQTSGTAGGASTATTWTTRVLNTESYDPDGIVSISSNKFTLAAGTYRVKAQSAFAGNAGSSSVVKLRFRNVTATTVLRVGVNTGMITGGFGLAEVEDTIVANGTDEFDLQYYVTAAKTSNGLGSPASEASANEIYTRIYIEQIG